MHEFIHIGGPLPVIGFGGRALEDLDAQFLPLEESRDLHIQLAGELNMKVATLFQGKELRVEIFECTPAKTNHRKRPTDVDEFVHVLSGKLILTEPNGTKHEYRPGDSLVLPVGYTGTWEMQGNYRELVVEAQKPAKPSR